MNRRRGGCHGRDVVRRRCGRRVAAFAARRRRRCERRGQRVDSSRRWRWWFLDRRGHIVDDYIRRLFVHRRFLFCGILSAASLPTPLTGEVEQEGDTEADEAENDEYGRGDRHHHDRVVQVEVYCPRRHCCALRREEAAS